MHIQAEDINFHSTETEPLNFSLCIVQQHLYRPSIYFFKLTDGFADKIVVVAAVHCEGRPTVDWYIIYALPTPKNLLCGLISILKGFGGLIYGQKFNSI